MSEIGAGALAEAGVFAALSDEQRATLVAEAEVVTHAAGEALSEEGAFGHRFHLLLEGAASVERGGREVATLGPGDFAGEIALLGGGRATATVRATEPTRCLTLGRERFWSVLEREPAIALRILEAVCRRLEREATDEGNLGA